MRTTRPGALLVGHGGVGRDRLALGGLPVHIDVFDFDLDTRRERIALTVGAVIVAGIGLVVLRMSRRSQR